MKHLALIVAAMLSMMTAVAQKSTLGGTLEGAPEGTKMVVYEPQNGHLVPIDTLNLNKKGNFSIEHVGNTDPVFFAMGLTVDHSPLLHVMLLPDEKVNMRLNYDQNNNTLGIESVSGSENMALYKQFNNMMNIAAANPAMQQAMPEAMQQMLSQNSGLLMSAFLVTYFESAFEQYAALYKQIRDALIVRYPNDQFVRHLDDKVRSVVVAGMEAPDIVMTDREGNVRRLSDLRGKVVLIDFWASWCRPCRMENPNVVRMYKKYKDQGFEIFSVSLDNSRDKWLQAIADDGLVWENHVSDLKGWSSSGGRLYGISSIPATVLVDRDGKVLARNLRGQELEQRLMQLFDEGK